MWLVALAACSLFDPDMPRHVDGQPHTVHRGQGWSVRVAEGATVTATTDELNVDAPDGTRWFDVRWYANDPPRPPVVVATGWGEDQCEPLQWDLPAEPVDGVWTAGGFCTIGTRRYWVIASVESFGDRLLLTGIVGNRDTVTYEDLWSDFLGTALTLTAAGEPTALLAGDEVRERLRLAYRDRPEAAELPRPGGGTFSRVVSEGMADVWTRRRTWSAPAHFVPVPIPVQEPENEARPEGEVPAGRAEDAP